MVNASVAGKTPRTVVNIAEKVEYDNLMNRKNFKQIEKDTGRVFNEHAELKLFGKILPSKIEQHKIIVPKE